MSGEDIRCLQEMLAEDEYAFSCEEISEQEEQARLAALSERRERRYGVDPCVPKIIDEREPATPLEELLCTVGLENMTKRYGTSNRIVIPHDFRWVGRAQDFLFKGEVVVQIVFPPAKVDIVPQTVLQNLAVRSTGYNVVTGLGTHLLMGATPANSNIYATMMVATVTRVEYFTVSRRSVVPAQGPVSAWCMGCVPFFSAANNVVWQDKLSPGDNIICVDGDLWYYPATRDPTVIVSGGRMIDRANRQLEVGMFDVPDGEYAYNIDTKKLMAVPIRPPVSLEVYNAWKKVAPIDPFLTSDRQLRVKCDVDPQKYKWNDKSALIRNPQLRSPNMMKKEAKYKEQCKEKFLEKVSRNMFLFYAYECASGRLWVAGECADGIGEIYGDVLEIEYKDDKGKVQFATFAESKAVVVGLALRVRNPMMSLTKAWRMRATKVEGGADSVKALEVFLERSYRSLATVARWWQMVWKDVHPGREEITVGEAARLMLA